MLSGGMLVDSIGKYHPTPVSLPAIRRLASLEPDTRDTPHDARAVLLPAAHAIMPLSRHHCLANWLPAGRLRRRAPPIRNVRSVYNDAINDTNNQQLLMVLIRERYSENSSLLAVSNVTANVSVSTSTGIQLGFGDESNYSGNLVPFSAAIAGPLGRQLHIRRARAKPENAYVAVEHHGWWYYIDKTDQPTKRFFHLLTVLWSVTIAESTSKRQTVPILMLPASH
jgi:hypothetical protein